MKAEDVVMKCPNCGATMQQYKGKYKCQYCEAIVAVKMPAKKKKKFSISAAYAGVKKILGEIAMGIGIIIAIGFGIGMLYGFYWLLKELTKPKGWW